MQLNKVEVLKRSTHNTKYVRKRPAAAAAGGREEGNGERIAERIVYVV